MHQLACTFSASGKSIADPPWIPGHSCQTCKTKHKRVGAENHLAQKMPHGRRGTNGSIFLRSLFHHQGFTGQASTCFTGLQSLRRARFPVREGKAWQWLRGGQPFTMITNGFTGTNHEIVHLGRGWESPYSNSYVWYFLMAGCGVLSVAGALTFFLLFERGSGAAGGRWNS